MARKCWFCNFGELQTFKKCSNLNFCQICWLKMSILMKFSPSATNQIVIFGLNRGSKNVNSVKFHMIKKCQNLIFCQNRKSKMSILLNFRLSRSAQISTFVKLAGRKCQFRCIYDIQFCPKFDFMGPKRL